MDALAAPGNRFDVLHFLHKPPKFAVQVGLIDEAGQLDELQNSVGEQSQPSAPSASSVCHA